MGRESISRFGRLGNLNITGSNPGRVKPMTLKVNIILWLVGWLSVRIMWLSEILGHGVGGLASQWSNTIYSHHEYTLSEVATRPDMTLDVARTQNNAKQTRLRFLLPTLPVRNMRSTDSATPARDSESDSGSPLRFTNVWPALAQWGRRARGCASSRYSWHDLLFQMSPGAQRQL